MLAPPDLQLLIATACSAVLTRVRTKVDEYDEACRKARAKNDEPPRPDLPRASSVRWVAWAAAEIAGAEFAGHGLPAWLRHSDLAAGFEDLAGQHLARLRGWREFTTLATSVIEIRWSRKPIVKKDPLLTETRCGRAKVVPTADRLAWSGEGDAPEFRLELSLPWFLLAEDDEIERGLHDLLDRKSVV